MTACGAVGDAAAPVEHVDALVFTVETDGAEADGTLSWKETTIVVATVEAGGTTGVGYTYAPAAAADVIRSQLRAAVVGVDAMDVARAAVAMQHAVRNAGRPGIAGCAVSAVDIAAWDLKAKLLGLPLHRLLGAVRDDVPVYGSGGFTTYDDDRLKQQLTGWAVHEEIPRVKIKIAESWGRHERRDLHRIELARAVIGADVQLYVDANGGYTVKQAIRMMDAVRDLDVTWLEEPVSSDDLTGLRTVRDAVPADVTAGEYGYHLPYFAHMLDAGAVDCLQIDLTRCGGITEWLRVSALAAAHNLEVSGHCAPHVHAAVASATPNLRHLEWFHDHVRIEQGMFRGTLDPQGGTIAPRRDRAGLGLDLRDPDDMHEQLGESFHVAS